VLMEKAARIIAANASTTADVYPAISFLLYQLKDNHSRLVLPQRVSALTDPLDEKARKALRQGVKPIGNLAYIEVPGFSQGRNSESAQAYIDSLAEGMREAALKKPCGWVVDARRNPGGGMHPMLAALAPLLGEGVLGYFVDTAEKRPLSIQEGAFRMADGYPYKASKPLVDDTLKTLPVALLSSAQTASAGEIMLVAFRGRPDTRMFGQPTSGRTSANTTVNLSDGAALAITSARLADRSGKIYSGRLMPDEVIEPSTDSSEDKTLAAALAWLKRQPACSKLTN
ncbi:MAG: peptidase S41, partial [Betaproteobacteria bacterium]|nr:peptidase S41 [Betaproteobacteria bacterium]